ncbi:hypothetical protein FQR65_LT08755 [Abscondita terminalis]|nr:hypothetical protein FQR65_LT08755 [Abscondita terminalis]
MLIEAPDKVAHRRIASRRAFFQVDRGGGDSDSEAYWRCWLAVLRTLMEMLFRDKCARSKWSSATCIRQAMYVENRASQVSWRDVDEPVALAGRKLKT